MSCAADIYDAIGGILQDVDINRSDEDIVEICEELYSLITEYLYFSSFNVKFIILIC